MFRGHISASLFIFLFLSGLCSVWSCQSDQNVRQDEIARLNGKLAAYFEAQQLSELTSLFADTAVIYGLGGYTVSGKEVITAYWQRYFLPLNMEVKTRQTSADLSRLQEEMDWPATFKSLPSLFTSPSKIDKQAIYEWAEWSLRYEGEDGVVRSEQFPVLIYWENIPNQGWRILRLYLG